MAESITWLVLTDPHDDLQCGTDASWTIEIAPTPEAAVAKWVGDTHPEVGEDRRFVVYRLDGVERFIVGRSAQWEVMHS